MTIDPRRYELTDPGRVVRELLLSLGSRLGHPLHSGSSIPRIKGRSSTILPSVRHGRHELIDVDLNTVFFFHLAPHENVLLKERATDEIHMRISIHYDAAILDVSRSLSAVEYMPLVAGVGLST